MGLIVTSEMQMSKPSSQGPRNVTLFGEAVFTEVISQDKIIRVSPTPVWPACLQKKETWGGGFHTEQENAVLDEGRV